MGSTDTKPEIRKTDRTRFYDRGVDVGRTAERARVLAWIDAAIDASERREQRGASDANGAGFEELVLRGALCSLRRRVDSEDEIAEPLPPAESRGEKIQDAVMPWGYAGRQHGPLVCAHCGADLGRTIGTAMNYNPERRGDPLPSVSVGCRACKRVTTVFAFVHSVKPPQFRAFPDPGSGGPVTTGIAVALGWAGPLHPNGYAALASHRAKCASCDNDLECTVGDAIQTVACVQIRCDLCMNATRFRALENRPGTFIAVPVPHKGMALPEKKVIHD